MTTRLPSSSPPPSTDEAPAPRPSENQRVSGQPDGVIEQAIALRDQLRATVAATTDLLRALQAEKRRHRLLKATLASLKELQKVAA